MEFVWLAVGLVIGIILGVGGAFLLRIVHLKTARDLVGETESERQRALETVIEQLRGQFSQLSSDALARSNEQFLNLAKEKLGHERELNAGEMDKKKELIDSQLKNMTGELEKVSKLVTDLEKDRHEKFGELTSQLKSAGQQTNELIHTTGLLKEALASTKARGQWGERMAEDVLRVAGFMEKVNYTKQKAIDGSGNRPDFTFFLPRDLKLNMDVKFPYDNYVKFLDAESETDRENYKKSFLRDVKAKIKEVVSRDYINPEQNTVDYVLLFIPNEQIYAFISETDDTILDDSIRNHVIICSPVTLFAVLAVIRQAVDNFTFEQTSNEILSLLGTFNRQWEKFTEALRSLGKRIEKSHDEFNVLISTRKNMLERPLGKIEEIRRQRGLPESSGALAIDTGSSADPDVISPE